MEPVFPCVLQIYRFVGGKAYPHREVRFEAGAKAGLLEALAVIRDGLPPGFGASLIDSRGHNVR
jgi:hypothetical protein